MKGRWKERIVWGRERKKRRLGGKIEEGRGRKIDQMRMNGKRNRKRRRGEYSIRYNNNSINICICIIIYNSI